MFGINAQLNGFDVRSKALKCDLLHCRQALIDGGYIRAVQTLLFERAIGREPIREPGNCRRDARPVARTRSGRADDWSSRLSTTSSKATYGT